MNIWWQIVASDLVFSNQVKWLHTDTDRKLFIVENNRAIVSSVIPWQMWQSQRRLIERRKLDEVQCFPFLILVLPYNHLLSGWLNDKWPEVAIAIFAEARGDPFPFYLKDKVIQIYSINFHDRILHRPIWLSIEMQNLKGWYRRNMFFYQKEFKWWSLTNSDIK